MIHFQKIHHQIERNPNLICCTLGTRSRIVAIFYINRRQGTENDSFLFSHRCLQSTKAE